MGHSIHTYFKPNNFFTQIEEVLQVCEKYLSDFNPVKMDDFVALDPWAWILDFPYNRDEDNQFPYLRLITQGFMDRYAEIECRNDIKRLCEAFGASEWWTCDENGDDAYCDLNQHDFEVALRNESFEYAAFIIEGTRWPSNCHFVHDSSKTIVME